ncbi:MAG: cob(I)yrinic acid a,c-diamide adenosyltransferase [Anaerolineaceae bacterium]|nr:cob(I)yrinic acid a,c-diamide adenosyltransferase [Anaerolineaceae bacterium]
MNNNKKKGLVIVNTGDGKGKTTAAVGLLIRAWGRDMRVGMLQFIKNKGLRSGEILAAEKMGIEIIPMGDGFTHKTKDIDESILLAQLAWKEAQKRILSNEYELLVLDEFTYALIYNWLEIKKVISWLKSNKPPMLHLVITGRNAPPALIEFADLVTEMTLIKHPYKEGIKSQPGIEY